MELLPWMDTHINSQSPIPKIVSCIMKPATFRGETLGIVFTEGAYNIREEIKIIGGFENKESINVSPKVAPYLDPIHQKTYLRWVFQKSIIGHSGIFKESCWVLIIAQASFELSEKILNEIKVMLEEEKPVKEEQKEKQIVSVNIKEPIEFTIEDISVIGKLLQSGISSPLQSPTKSLNK
jgi:hypothetical protein